MEAGARELERIAARLEELATELDGESNDERAEELVKEVSRLAAEAGEELERMLNRVSGPQR